MLTMRCRSCLARLPKDCIDSLDELCAFFTSQYCGTWERPGNRRMLDQILQRNNESLRSYIRRFFEKNSLLFVEEHHVISALQHGLAYDKLVNTWAQMPPQIANELFTVVNLEANNEEAEREQLRHIKSRRAHHDSDRDGKTSRQGTRRNRRPKP